MIHIYCGDGKGKTTAAFGLCVRASGAGFNVIIAQFLKSRNVSELNTFDKLENITLLRGDLENIFTFQMNDAQKAHTLNEHNTLLNSAVNLYKSSKSEKTLLVLDEILGALSEKLIDEATVLDFLRTNKDNQNLEIVLTGRNPSDEILALGDYITEMVKRKHPYDNGVNMRKGIEY